MGTVEQPEDVATDRAESWTGARQTRGMTKLSLDMAFPEEQPGTFRQIWKALEGRGRDRWFGGLSDNDNCGTGDESTCSYDFSCGSRGLPQNRRSRERPAFEGVPPYGSSPPGSENDKEASPPQNRHSQGRHSLRSVDTTHTVHRSRRTSTKSTKSVFSTHVPSRGKARQGTQTWNQGGVWRGGGFGLDVDSVELGCDNDGGSCQGLRLSWGRQSLTGNEEQSTAGEDAAHADSPLPDSGGSALNVRFVLPKLSTAFETNGEDCLDDGEVRVVAEEAEERPFKSCIWESPSECSEPQPLMPVPPGQTPPVAESPRPPNDPSLAAPVDQVQVGHLPPTCSPTSILRRGASV